MVLSAARFLMALANVPLCQFLPLGRLVSMSCLMALVDEPSGLSSSAIAEMMLDLYVVHFIFWLFVVVV